MSVVEADLRDVPPHSLEGNANTQLEVDANKDVIFV